LGTDDDRWSRWVLDRGHGGQPDDERADMAYLIPIRDRLLSGAKIRPGETVLDVGAGDGLIAFAAADLVAPSGTVIFSDVSQALLKHARSVAERRGLADRTSFVRASAEDLAPIEDGSVDVVTTRSVLIYVEDKQGALREFYRVLRPGGRVSIFEPINRYFEESADYFWGFDARPVEDLVAKIWAGEDTEDPDEAASDPMMNFGERDLFDAAEDAGFEEVRVELVVERAPGSWVEDWDALLKTAPNPNAPTVRETIEAALTPEEAARFEVHLKPLADSGRGVRRSAFAYLCARRDGVNIP
jgi:ubiquinone/menaquinone biosynthesis C-methylase UbiE